MRIEKSPLRKKELRTRILEYLIAAGSPRSHSDIMETEGFNGADRVSVYRNLSALKEARLVHSVQGTDSVWRFCAHEPEAPGCPGGHAHFFCTLCKEMFCLKEQEIPQVDVPEGFRVEGKQLVLYGVCPACQTKSPPSPA